MENEIYRRAHIYESLFQDYRDDIDWVEGYLLNEPAPGEGPLCVLEMACGAGRIVGGLQKRIRGWGIPNQSPEFWGVDISSDMIALAARRYPEIKWIYGDILSPGMGGPPAGFYSHVLLMANTLAHFIHAKERETIYANMERLLRDGGQAMVAVMTVESFAESEESAVMVGSCRDETGEIFDVYEQSRKISQGEQTLHWYFLSRGGKKDFETSFSLARFTRGQIGGELKSRGAEIILNTHGYETRCLDQKLWDIYVYRL